MCVVDEWVGRTVPSILMPLQASQLVHPFGPVEALALAGRSARTEADGFSVKKRAVLACKTALSVWAELSTIESALVELGSMWVCVGIAQSTAEPRC